MDFQIPRFPCAVATLISFLTWISLDTYIGFRKKFTRPSVPHR